MRVEKKTRELNAVACSIHDVSAIQSKRFNKYFDAIDAKMAKFK